MIKKHPIKKEQYFQLLADIDNAIVDIACGCMGFGYTAEREAKEQPHYLDNILLKYFIIN